MSSFPCQIVDCCVEYEKEEKLGRLLDEMATERSNKVSVHDWGIIRTPEHCENEILLTSPISHST